MKQFLVKATIAFTFILPSFSMAEETGFDEFACSESPMMQLSPLRCVNCGLQKYNDKKNVTSAVSEKWLALLALNAMRYAPARLKGAEKTQYIQQQVARSLQVYGHCSRYASKEARGTGGDDMTVAEKNELKTFLNYSSKPSEKQWEAIAKKYGFNPKGIIFNRESTANETMESFFAGSDDSKATLASRREAFQAVLKEEFDPKHDSQGDSEPKSERRSFFAKGDDDQGLRRCAQEIYNNKSKDLAAQKELYNMCDTIAYSCDLPSIRKTSGDICKRNGMYFWTQKEIDAATREAGLPVHSKPSSSKDPGQPPPPPPGSSRSGNR